MEELLNIPWGRFALLFAFFYLLFIGLAWIFGNKILFPVPIPSTYELSSEFSRINTKKETSIALFREGEIISPKWTILYSHGNGEDLGKIKNTFKKWKGHPWEFIAYDYPGYGMSEGKPSEQGCYEAIDSIFHHLTETLGRPPEKIIAWGRSLGTGPSCYLASRQRLGGLILETPFLSAFRTVTEIPVLPWDYFENISLAEDINLPSLIIHGRWDEVVPFRQGKKLHSLLPEPKTFIEIENASHNDLEEAGGESYRAGIENFIQGLGS